MLHSLRLDTKVIASDNARIIEWRSSFTDTTGNCLRKIFTWFVNEDEMNWKMAVILL